MSSVIKRTLKKTFIYDLVKFIRRRKETQAARVRGERDLLNWEASGKPIPPPHGVKQRIVKDYARRFSLDTMIETGTYLGDMLDATRDAFTSSFSIELDRKLYEQAKRRFHSDQRISIIHGDSAEVLPAILAGIDKPCLFWLDGHYSGDITAKGKVDTPIVDELNHIFNHAVAGHVILIDDARCFVGENSYPTIDELRGMILERHPDWVFEVEHDVIRIHKGHGNSRIARRPLTRVAAEAIGSLVDRANRQAEEVPNPRLATVALWFEHRGDQTLRLDYDLDENSVVFDLGGYEGQWTSDIFSRYCCLIHVFEPVQDYAQQIEKRFAKNRRIVVHQHGLASESCTVKIAMDRDESSIFKRGVKTTEGILVKAIDFLRDNEISKIDLMKINIEGGEYELLEHLIETKFVRNIENLQVQFHDFVPDAEQRMTRIQKDLEKTHSLTYQYRFVWENWRLKRIVLDETSTHQRESL